jgi:hypothetical protein
MEANTERKPTPSLPCHDMQVSVQLYLTSCFFRLCRQGNDHQWQNVDTKLFGEVTISGNHPEVESRWFRLLWLIIL